MSNQPLVSIVTVVFNGQEHLEQTIRSVLDQTYPHIEYIIIDGGSKDRSVEIIKQYSERLAYWVSEKDKGISDAFNKGIARATGSIIGLINADDWYEPNAVAKMVEAMQDADIGYADLQYWKEGKKDMIVEGNHEMLLYEMSVNHPTVFVRSECYKKFGGFRLECRYAMDYDLMLRFRLNGCRFVRVPQVLANMRWEGISDQQWYKACKEVREIKKLQIPDKIMVHDLYFHKQVASIKMGRFLHRLQLKRTIRFYRRWLSPIRKRY